MTTDEIGIGTVLYMNTAPLREYTITDETRGTWVLGDGRFRVNKSTLKVADRDGGYQFYTAQQIEELRWNHIHRAAIVKLIWAADAATLRKVAQAVGYVAE